LATIDESNCDTVYTEAFSSKVVCIKCAVELTWEISLSIFFWAFLNFLLSDS